MPTYARTNKPLKRVNSGEMKAYLEQSGKTKLAIIGDGSNNIKVASNGDSSNYGFVWIRLVQGTDVNGEAVTGVPTKAVAQADFYPAQGMPVRVSKNRATGFLEIQGNDVAQARAGGINTNSFNAHDPSRYVSTFADIRNMRTFAIGSATTTSTKISIEPYIYIYNGVVRFTQKGQSDNIDLASYIPTAGNERLVGVALKASDNTVQIVGGTARTITNSTWSLSAIQELYDGLDSDAMPIDIYRLSNAQTNITNDNRLFDWRQVVNVPGTNNLGYPNPVSAPTVVADGYTLLVADSIKITTGNLTLGDSSVLKIFNI